MKKMLNINYKNMIDMADDVWCIYELIFADGVETIDLHVALK